MGTRLLKYFIFISLFFLPNNFYGNIFAGEHALGSFNNPYPSATPQVMPDGWLIEVIKFNSNAWPVIKSENQFNDPPSSGKKMAMVTVRVVNDSTSTQPNLIKAKKFSMVGSKKELYGDGCGVIPNELDKSLFFGGEGTGNVCFEVGESETDFLLVYEHKYNDYIFLKIE